LTEILEIQFQLQYNMKSINNVDTLDLFEFLWMYERLAKEKKSENANQNHLDLRQQRGG